MKKLIVLFAILAMVSVASAGIVDIQISSLNGLPITAVKEITITPSTTVDMQITFTGPATEWAYSVGAMLNVTGPATVDVSQAVRNPLYEAWAEVITPATNSIIEASAQDIGPLIPQGNGPTPVILVSNLLLHCDAVGTVTVSLSDDAVFGSMITDVNWNPVDWSYGTGVIIHQVPEPMTLVLLGLGSLFLARRKK